MICLWLGPPWFNYWFSFTLAYSRISQEYSSLLIIVINLNFMFSLWCTDWVESFYANRIFMYFWTESRSWPRVKLASCKSALNPPHPTHTVVYSTDRSKAMVPVLVLLLVALWFTLRGFVLCLSLCYFVLLFYSPFSIAITLLGEERANLSAFRMFVRFALVWFCLFSFPLGVWEGCGLWLCTLWTFLLPFLYPWLFEMRLLKIPIWMFAGRTCPKDLFWRWDSNIFCGNPITAFAIIFVIIN